MKYLGAVDPQNIGWGSVKYLGAVDPQNIGWGSVKYLGAVDPQKVSRMGFPEIFGGSAPPKYFTDGVP